MEHIPEEEERILGAEDHIPVPEEGILQLVVDKDNPDQEDTFAFLVVE